MASPASWGAASDASQWVRGESAPLPDHGSPFDSAVPASANPFRDASSGPASSGHSTNPYASPTQPGGIVSPYANLTYLQRRLLAERKVKGPALAMIVVQVIAVVMALFQLVAMLMRANVRDMDVLLPMINVGIKLGMSALIVYGAWCMHRLRAYSWAMVAVILSIIPCNGCCLLGMPVGIWALVVLNDGIVKIAFD